MIRPGADAGPIALPLTHSLALVLAARAGIPAAVEKA
jgi:hypothetical protein